ncbi:hypothetical protein V6N12_072093 [Hibiscus sabdariffa]|uniref:Hydroxyproline-rich glycoprotein family protein n=1 Tax=Hibiscus sabdariffa TaxID=183260 RepID=A0ABR2FM85_9ROSI
MKGRCSKHETKDGMEIDKIKEEPEPHLSGAYIRSLVKHISTSRTKNSAEFGDGFSGTPPQTTQPPPQQHKKQVRRRLHTSRPNQERLLDMAEARREIVTALKFHRASMKHANDQQNRQQQLQQLSHTSDQLSSPPPFEQEPNTKCRRNPRISSSYSLDSFSSSSQHQPPPPVPASPYSWPAPHQTCLPSPMDATNFTLPNQTLGLNLNFQDFNTIDTGLYHNNNNPSSSSVGTEEVPSVALSSHEVGTGAMAAGLTESYGRGGLHQAMDDEEMAEIRSLGEQHQMEWDDTVNLVTSAWWFKFLKTMELGDGSQPFDQVMEFPACLPYHFTDLCPDYYFQDPDLPW